MVLLHERPKTVVKLRVEIKTCSFTSSNVQNAASKRNTSVRNQLYEEIELASTEAIQLVLCGRKYILVIIKELSVCFRSIWILIQVETIFLSPFSYSLQNFFFFVFVL